MKHLALKRVSAVAVTVVLLLTTVFSLSVFANHLKQKMGDVLHGEIKEVSLVQAGANPGALIDVVISHADDDDVEMYDEVGKLCKEDADALWGYMISSLNTTQYPEDDEEE